MVGLRWRHRPYLALTEQDAKQLPLLDTENLEEEFIYKGDLYCRYPGCLRLASHRH